MSARGVRSHKGFLTTLIEGKFPYYTTRLHDNFDVELQRLRHSQACAASRKVATSNNGLGTIQGL